MALTPLELDTLCGVTIEDVEFVEREGLQVLRLFLEGGDILAITAEGGGLSVADESAVG